MRGATEYYGNDYTTTTFQSTLLMRGATFARDVISANSVISIHAPHARSDGGCRSICKSIHIFQSTLLMRGATLDYYRHYADVVFQSTLLMRGATWQGVFPLKPE